MQTDCSEIRGPGEGVGVGLESEGVRCPGFQKESVLRVLGSEFPEIQILPGPEVYGQ